MIDAPIDNNLVANALADSLSQWLTKLAQQEVEQIREDISVPVEYVERNGVIFVIRSRPGEPPRTETGALIKGIKFVVEDSDQLPNLLIYSERNSEGDDPRVPQFLEAARRPYITTALTRVRDRLRT